MTSDVSDRLGHASDSRPRTLREPLFLTGLVRPSRFRDITLCRYARPLLLLVAWLPMGGPATDPFADLRANLKVRKADYIRRLTTDEATFQRELPELRAP